VKTAKNTAPKWHPASEALVRTFHDVMEALPQAESRKVFGYPAAFTNGQMFAGLHQDNMILRLPDEDRARFLQLKGAHAFEPMPGRPMREYVVVPKTMMKTGDELQAWLEKAFTYANTLPPKAPKAKRPSRKSITV
jgi:TfoX/Sxy family transcriptional regulator of competence genes